ncbi:MAG: restriction endonuclease [Candidatus Margulisbacteria bacterium]|nr:restriction endonuclease [Candidatus Margulisiibacteriota bacterium]
MSNYNFSTLNDKEFEQISKDLLNAKYCLDLQDFKVGKDKGIDLRFSTPKNNNSIVVQVKHYVGSGFAQLKHTLLNKELDKIRFLKPDRYIIVTSLPLSPSNKDELRENLSPFVLTSNDIFGQEDLNGFLDEFGEIEKRYFKLWFSSVNVFNTLINNAIEGRTRYLLEKIREKISFYVVTKKLDDANQILQKEKVLLITGQPGIGKTTLAEIIIFDRARNGFKIYEVENIKEAEDVLSSNREEKQLFYFDDFLGSNYFEIVNSHKTETQLTSFVERVRNTPNKYLILTTRTVILNLAIERYEKISHSKLASQQFEIKLTDYTKYEKALILYNHLYFKGVKEELYSSILNDKFYKIIIQHKNYTPRIIEFITDNSKIEQFTATLYHQFILNNLNNPREIWRYSFNNQITYLDRCLLLTLFSFESGSNETDLINAFENRLIYEKEEHNQIINANQFNESIRTLLNGFINATLYTFISPQIRIFNFINPSLFDFLMGHVSESFQERKSIISSITYFEQLKVFDQDKSKIPLEKELQIIIRDRISQSKITVSNIFGGYLNNENNKNAIILESLCKYCQQVNIDTLLLEYIQKLDYEGKWSYILPRIEYFLLNLGDAPQTRKYIKENFIKLVERIMASIDEVEDAKLIPKLFEEFGFDYKDYSESESGSNKLINLIESVLLNAEDNLKDDKKGNITDIDGANEIYDEIAEIENELSKELFPDIAFNHNFGIEIDEAYWAEIIDENKMKQWENESDDYRNNSYYKNESILDSFNEDLAIDDLFVKSD